MIGQDAFVAARKPDWDELAALLALAHPLSRLPAGSISRAAALYRATCGDLMRAQAAGYGPEVMALLDGLAARAHNALYSSPPYRLAAVWELVAADFPRALRRHGRFFALAAALFVLPGVVGFAGAHASRPFAMRLLSPPMVAQMERAYAEGFGKGRDEGADTAMAGFYVYNNIGIAFRCFATGILFGLGSAFFLVYNGLVIGAVMGLVTAAGHGRNLFTFASGHGAFELTAIVISGAAGLLMGYSLIATGGRTRFGSLRARARELAHLVLGAALMLAIAALLEGYWSPSGLPAPVKWAAAALFYALVGLYLARAGRRGEPAARQQSGEASP